MKHKLLISFFLILIIVSIFFGFGYTGKVSEYITPDEQGSIDVYFCPADNCREVYSNIIKDSNNINCAIFEMDSIIQEFDRKSSVTNVKIVSDNSAKHKLTNFSFVRFDNNNQLMHNKFCLFEKNNKKFILTGSLNPTENGFNKDRNNLVVIGSNYLYENYKEEFNELWNGFYGEGEKVQYSRIYFNGFLLENYFCPEDECESKLFNLIKNSNERIYFMTFSFTSDTIGDYIIKKSSEGIDVKGIFDKLKDDKYSEFSKMKEKKLNVKVYEGALLHHKVFIIDDTVLFGSYNPTSSGDERNDEKIIIIHDKEIADKFVKELNYLFENGK